MSGKIHIYCGDGKGKTTASVGLTIRMTGAGGRTLFAQFMKNGRSSELSVLRSLERVTVVTCNTVTGFYKNMTPEQRRRQAGIILQCWNRYWRAAGTVDLLVLDEILSACNHGIVEEAVLRRFLEQRPAGLEVVLTGRDPSPALCAMADYITEMKKQKHPYDTGVLARRGIEF